MNFVIFTIISIRLEFMNLLWQSIIRFCYFCKMVINKTIVIGISLSHKSCTYEFNASIDFWLKITSQVHVIAPSTVLTSEKAKLLPIRWGIILRSTVRTSDFCWISLPLLLQNGSQIDTGIGFAQKTASGQVISSILVANKYCQSNAVYVSFEMN